MHDSLLLATKILGVAFAVGLDVFAVSISVGVARLAFNASLRVGFAFALSEIVMQVVGYELGTGAGRILGEVAVYAGIALLTLIGVLMIRNSSREPTDVPVEEFKASEGVGLFMTSLSISLDSLGVGVALPAVAIPLVPLLITVSVTTTIFTMVGLAFGARLGERYERRAELAGGVMLVVLAVSFAIERLV